MPEPIAEKTAHTNNEEINSEKTEQTNNEGYVNKKDIADIVARSVQAALRRSNKEPSTERQTTKNEGSTNESSENKSLRLQFKQLQDERRQEREEIAREKKETAIQSAISGFGLDTDNAELFESFIYRKFDKDIKYEGKKVIYEDAKNGDVMDVKDFIKSVFNEKKDRFLPAIQTANTRGSKESVVRKAETNSFLKLTDYERQKMQKEKPDEYRQLLKTAYSN